MNCTFINQQSFLLVVEELAKSMFSISIVLLLAFYFFKCVDVYVVYFLVVNNLLCLTLSFILEETKLSSVSLTD